MYLEIELQSVVTYFPLSTVSELKQINVYTFQRFF